MFWQQKEKTAPSAPQKSILEQLYADRKMPEDIKMDMSFFSEEEQKEYKRFEFIRPYLNIRLSGLWAIQQKDSHWGTVNAYDQPNQCLVFDIFHGEKSVGELNFQLNINPFAPDPDDLKGSISTKFHAFWFDANEVRFFLHTLASIHHDYT